MDRPLNPILFIDVDGPLNPYAASPSKRPAGYETHRLNPTMEDGTKWANGPRDKLLRVWLNPAHGAALLSTDFDLVWATTWEHEANELIGPRIGLPELPVVEFPVRDSDNQLYFKTMDVVYWANGRKFVWVDDEVSPYDQEYITRYGHEESIAMKIDPAKGLVESDFRQLHNIYKDMTGACEREA